jgi:hypothetical protein
MSWKDIIKEEMPRPPKSRLNTPMTCENGHSFTSGEVKYTKKLGAPSNYTVSKKCPTCGKKAKCV